MGSFLVIFPIVLIALAFFAYRKWCQLRSLFDRTAAELSQLKSQLAGRHLIVSHLSDSLPSVFAPSRQLKSLRKNRQEAEGALSEIDPPHPNATSIRRFSLCEQDFIDIVEKLVREIERDESVSKIQSVAGCLEGLKRANGEIAEIVSIYNASAIAYANMVDSSMMGRLIPARDFGLFDLSPHSSDLSQDRVAS
ncbi:MAG: hypothetical protein ACR2NZ_00665 [Rubripirellula sp.]